MERILNVGKIFLLGVRIKKWCYNKNKTIINKMVLIRDEEQKKDC